MHRLLLSASAVIAVAGTLVLITVTVIARDVVPATGAQLITVMSAAWQKRDTRRKPAQACTACGGAV